MFPIKRFTQYLLIVIAFHWNDSCKYPNHMHSLFLPALISIKTVLGSSDFILKKLAGMRLQLRTCYAVLKLYFHMIEHARSREVQAASQMIQSLLDPSSKAFFIICFRPVAACNSATSRGFYFDLLRFYGFSICVT